MSRRNNGKPFYVDVGTSIVAVRCASNHDVVLEYDHSWRPSSIELARTACDRMNKEAEIGRPRRNCDVGTADDWMARFSIVCERCSGSDCDHRLFKDEEVCDCFARWLQCHYKAK